MLIQSPLLLLCFLPFLLCQVVINKDRPHRFIWENAPSFEIEGSGLELEAKNIHPVIGPIGQFLTCDRDYTIENLGGRRGLKINLLTQWVDFTRTTSPASLMLMTVYYEGYSLKVLPYPVVIATVFRIPTLLPSTQMIYPSRSQVLRINGTNLIGLERISLSFSKEDNNCLDSQFFGTITSSFPLKDDFLSLENFYRYSLNTENNDLRVYGICSPMGFVNLNGDDGVLIARFHPTITP